MRINLLAGSCVGKSRTAARLYGDEMFSNTRLELVREFVKKWAYQGRKITGFDQVKIFGEQLYSEELVLKSSSNIHIITDSPLLLQVFYAKNLGEPVWGQLFEIVKEFDKKYPCVNILLDRGDIPYDNHGRYESESESKQISKNLRKFLVDENIKFEEFFTKEYHAISQYVKYRLYKENEKK